tara:strand:- start:217 stop:558 length:342 start_codon:yes stop_codon:yes gene_type:complete
VWFDKTDLLLPLHLLLITGLATSTDPLASALGALGPTAASAARDLSLGIYLLQDSALHAARIWAGWGDTPPREKTPAQLVATFTLLILAAAAVHYAVQRPVASATQHRLGLSK